MIVVSVHPPRRATLAVLIALLSIVDDLQASSRFAYQEQELQGLQCAAGLFRADRGEYPRTDGESTWFAKLVKGGYVSPGQLKFGCTPDGLDPLDMYGSPIIAQIVPNVSGAEEFVLRCAGPNGVDDGGSLDDWDIRFGPNAGYWYKTHWPSLYRSATKYGLICGLATAIVSAILLWFASPKLRAAGLLSVVVGILWLILWPSGDASLLFTASSDRLGDPGWVETVRVAATLLLLAGILQLVILAGRAASESLERRWSRPENTCIRCGYDLRGCPTSVCPECGMDQKAARCS